MTTLQSERFEPRSHFIRRWNVVVMVSVVLNGKDCCWQGLMFKKAVGKSPSQPALLLRPYSFDPKEGNSQSSSCLNTTLGVSRNCQTSTFFVFSLRNEIRYFICMYLQFYKYLQLNHQSSRLGQFASIIKAFTCKNLWTVISCNIHFKSILKSKNRYHYEISQQPACSNIPTCSNV